MSGFIPSDRSPMTDGWLVFGRLLSESVSPARALVDEPRDGEPRDGDARVLGRWRLLDRLPGWWRRPLSAAGRTSSIDVATRLESAVRGSFPRERLASDQREGYHED
jgi:hypothetical protein